MADIDEYCAGLEIYERKEILSLDIFFSDSFRGYSRKQNRTGQ